MRFSELRVVLAPLSLDDYTKNKSWSFFACVLVDVDLLSDFPNQILVERP